MQNLSKTEQLERAMIGKLKTESGYHWISKLEDMLKDIQESKEFIDEYHKKFPVEYPKLELNVKICTTCAWPLGQIQPVIYPQDIKYDIDRFTQFYLSKNSDRRLNFKMDKGKADIQVQFNANTKKILVCTTYQMMVLLLFNYQITWTFGDMLQATGIYQFIIAND